MVSLSLQILVNNRYAGLVMVSKLFVPSCSYDLKV